MCIKAIRSLHKQYIFFIFRFASSLAMQIEPKAYVQRHSDPYARQTPHLCKLIMYENNYDLLNNEKRKLPQTHWIERGSISRKKAYLDIEF